MERPFANSRPVGPVFSNSDAFRERFMSDAGETFAEGDVGFIKVGTTDPNLPDNHMVGVVEFAMSEVEEFVEMSMEGEGELDGGALLIEYRVRRVRDDDVTVSQLERGMLDIAASEENITSLGIYNKKVQ